MKLPKPKYDVVMEGRYHRYAISKDGKIEAKNLASVTGVLDKAVAKPALVNWASRTACDMIESALIEKLEGLEANRVVMNAEWIKSMVAEGRKRPQTVKTEAAIKGTLIHSLCQKIAKGEPLGEIPDDIRAIISSYEKWFWETKTKIVATELPVGSLKNLYGGTIDAVGYNEDRGGYGICDYKTSKGVYTEMCLQTAGGYALAFEEQYGLPVAWVDIVRISKEEPLGVEVVPVGNIKEAQAAFLHAKYLSDALVIKFAGEPSYSNFAQVAAAKAEAKASEAIAANRCPF